MASDSLEEKKPEDEAPMEEKQEEAKDEEPEKENVEEDTVKVAEDEDEKVDEEGGEEKVEEEAETPKKAKRGRRTSSKKEETESTKKKKKSSKEADVEKKEKEPVTPASERPTRERKLVERYSAPESGRSSAGKALSIEKGRGTELKNIPNVAFKLSKRKADDNLQLFHTILFGKKAKSHILKKNISQFSGYVWAENEQEKQRTRVKEKLDKCVKEKLVDFCDFLNIPVTKASTRKEDISAKLLEFLESPHATTDVLLADKEQKGQKRRRKVTPSKSAGTGEESPEMPPKKQKEAHSAEKKQESAKAGVDEGDDKVETSDDSGEGEDDDAKNEETDHEDKSDEEQDEPKEEVSSPKSSSKKTAKDGSKVKAGDKGSTSKKKTPAKSVKKTTDSAKKSSSTSKRGASDADGASGSTSKRKSAKKQKTEKESEKDVKEKATGKKQSIKSPAKAPAKDQGKGKASKKSKAVPTKELVKAEPTNEELHLAVVDILKEVDFNTATLSDILRQLGTQFGVDLMHRKNEVKGIITDVINTMSDEEDEGDDETEEAEAGDDVVDKDDDNDDDGDA